MSLEQKIELLTTEIVSLKEVIAGIIANGGNAAAGSATEAKGAANKGAANKGAAGKGGASKKEEDKPTSVHTLAELQKLLNDYKEVFGLPAAKKLLPGMGYESSKAVPADKIDEVFDAVTELLEAEAAKGGDDGDL